MSRLDDLRDARKGVLDRMDECASDQTYAVLTRVLMDLLVQIDELDPPKRAEGTGLDEFTRRLRERESVPKGSRRAKQA